jgi:anthranilate phosphoribosyltransferase
MLANFLDYLRGPPRCRTTILTRAIDAVCSGTHLTADHASAVLAEIMEGRPARCRRRLPGRLRAKGETVPELIGLARTMRGARRPRRDRRDDLVDTAGTGAARRPSTSRPPRR